MTEERSLYPHEVVPEPHEDAPLRDWTRYHVARAQGYWLRFATFKLDDVDRESVTLAIQSGEYALTLVALLKGLSGEEAYRWAAERVPGGGVGEWLWQCGQELDIDMASIKALKRR